MKNFARLLMLLTLVMLPFFVYAQMMGPKGEAGTWEGLVSGNECILDGMKCKPSHVKMEVPGLIPETKGRLDVHHFYYFASLPPDVQRKIFLKEVKVTGTLYPSFSTVNVKSVAVKEGNKWKTVWAAPKMEKGM